MNIEKYTESFKGALEKETVLEDIALIRDEITKNALESYQTAKEVLKGDGYKSEFAHEFDKKFKKSAAHLYKYDFVSSTVGVLKTLLEGLDAVESFIDEKFADDITSAGMTYMKANALYLVEMYSFVGKYATMVISLTLSAETARDKKEDVRAELTKAEQKWLNENEVDYFRILGVLAVPAKDITKALNKIPDVLINAGDPALVRQMAGAAAMDPFKSNLVGKWWNPVIPMRMRMTEWAVERHKKNVEERMILEFKLLNLKNQKAGRDDPKLQQHIEAVQGRLDKLNAKIAKMENGHG